MLKSLLTLGLFVALRCFAQPGMLDPSFGNNGKIDVGFGKPKTQGFTMIETPEGKILCAGSTLTSNTAVDWETDTDNAFISRYNADGSMDNTFGTNGTVVLDHYRFYPASGWNMGILSLKVLNDGKILAYGFRNLVYGRDLILLRFNEDGSMDNSFGHLGMMTYLSQAIPGNQMVEELPDGKLLLLSAEMLPADNSSKFKLQRIKTNGDLDSTFAVDGSALQSFGILQAFPSSMKLQSDGKVVLVGNGSNGRTLLARYTSNGVLDTSFDGDGRLITAFGTSCAAYRIDIDSDGKIITFGTATQNNTSLFWSMVRYLPNGAQDNTFDGDGRVLIAVDASINPYMYIKSALRLSDGSYILHTLDPNVLNNSMLHKFNGNGVLDASFGENGILNLTYKVESVSEKSNGNLLVVGTNSISENESICISHQYFSSGTLFPDFYEAHRAACGIESTYDVGQSVLQRADGKLMIVGTVRTNFQNQSFRQTIGIAQLKADGTLDSLFAENGKARIDIGVNYVTVRSAVLQPDQKIVIMITYVDLTTNQNVEALVRINADATIDGTFGSQGIYIHPVQPLSLFALSDGKIALASYVFNNNNEPSVALYRLNADGTLDASFEGNGVPILPGISFTTPTIAELANGKLALSTSPILENGQVGMKITQFLSNGTIDPSFVQEPLVVSGNSYAFQLFVDDEQRLIVAGRSYHGETDYNYFSFTSARYLPSGDLDVTYGTNGIKDVFFTGIYDIYTEIRSIARQQDGAFVLAMTRIPVTPSYPYTGTSDGIDMVVRKIDPEGNNDVDFGSSSGISVSFYTRYDEAYACTLLPDNSIVMVGCTDNMITRNFAVAKLQNNIITCAADTSFAAATACASFQWNDQTLFESGRYTLSNITLAGCDSVAVLDLEIRQPSSFSQALSLCNGESIQVGNELLTEAGVYTTTIIANNGCDSVVTTTIVQTLLEGSVSVDDNTITAIGFPANATYQWLDCNAQQPPIQGATDVSFTATQTGDYALLVSLNNCTQTTACVNVVVTSIGISAEFDQVQCYPNPASNELYVRTSQPDATRRYRLLDTRGKVIRTGKMYSSLISIDLNNVAPGLYLLEVMQDNENSAVVKVEKR